MPWQRFHEKYSIRKKKLTVVVNGSTLRRGWRKWIQSGVHYGSGLTHSPGSAHWLRLQMFCAFRCLPNARPLLSGSACDTPNETCPCPSASTSDSKAAHNCWRQHSDPCPHFGERGNDQARLFFFSLSCHVQCLQALSRDAIVLPPGRSQPVTCPTGTKAF